MEKPLVIIPARGGSKGLPGKNIADLHGKPLIAWSIKFGLNNIGTGGKVYVSTDSDEIARVSCAAGAGIISRPEEIAGDLSTTESALEHAISVVGDSFSHLILLQCTSPFRSQDLVQRADRLLKDTPEARSVLTTRTIEQFQWRAHEGLSLIEPTYDLSNRPMRQQRKEHDMVIVETGNMYVTSMQSFKDKLCRVDPRRCCGLETDRYESHEIDTSEDLKLARAFAKIDFIQDRYSPW